MSSVSPFPIPSRIPNPNYVDSYALATAHAFLSLARTIQGFTVEVVKSDGAVLYFADNSQPLNRSTGSIYTTMVRICDRPSSNANLLLLQILDYSLRLVFGVALLCGME